MLVQKYILFDGKNKEKTRSIKYQKQITEYILHDYPQHSYKMNLGYYCDSKLCFVFTCVYNIYAIYITKCIPEDDLIVANLSTRKNIFVALLMNPKDWLSFYPLVVIRQDFYLFYLLLISAWRMVGSHLYRMNKSSCSHIRDTAHDK